MFVGFLSVFHVCDQDVINLKILSEEVYSLKIFRSQKHVSKFSVWYCNRVGILLQTCQRRHISRCSNLC